MKFDRRQTLALIGLGATAAPQAATAAAKGTFQHGVAAGDPLQDRLVIWTRVTPDDPATDRISIDYAVARADRPAKKVAQGRAFTGAGRDFTVKVDVGGLKAGEAYVYWFEAGPVKSPVGRARTLPKGAAEDVVLAVATCALWPGGFYNAYEAIAAQPRVDAVVHLGDYIYEYGVDGYGGDIGQKIGRFFDPPTECLTLADYRRRHAQAKSDPKLQAAHAKAPWIVVWDDHETANDSWTTGAENHQPDKEGGWNERKAAAMRAWYEWMPIRDPEPGRAFEAINRSFHFGDLASLIMVETRLTARSQPLDYAKDLPIVDGRPDLAAFGAKLNDPARSMMGETQEAWLASELAASVGAGRRWQVLGNQVVMAKVIMPDIRKAMGEAGFAAMVAQLPPYAVEPVQQSLGIAALGLPTGLDTWDGYPAARERLYGILKASGASPVVVSGDSHAFWANELRNDKGELVAAEFGAAGISSPGYNDFMPGAPFGEVIPAQNKEVIFTDHAAKGFLLLTLTREAVKAEMVMVSTVYAPQYETKVLKAFEVKPVEGGVGPVTAL